LDQEEALARDPLLLQLQEIFVNEYRGVVYDGHIELLKGYASIYWDKFATAYEAPAYRPTLAAQIDSLHRSGSINSVQAAALHHLLDHPPAAK
jgi:hypothetical protein